MLADAVIDCDVSELRTRTAIFKYFRKSPVDDSEIPDDFRNLKKLYAPAKVIIFINLQASVFLFKHFQHRTFLVEFSCILHCANSVSY